MRAAVLRDGRMVIRDDVPEPVQARVRCWWPCKACGICGSDLHFAKHGAEVLALGDQMTGTPSYGGMDIDLNRDVFMGHEFSAEVLEAGPDTDAPAPGTVVTSLPVLLSADGYRADRVLQHHDRRLRRADAVVGTAADAHPQRIGSAPRRADRADGGRPARGQQVGDPARRAGAGARLRPDRHRDHRRTAPSWRGNHCGCRLFIEAARACRDDGRTPQLWTRRRVRRSYGDARGGVRGGGRAGHRQRRAAPGTIGARSSSRGCAWRPTRCSRSSPSPSRSTCSSCSPTTPTEFRRFAAPDRRGRDRRRPDSHRRGGTWTAWGHSTTFPTPDAHCKILVTPQGRCQACRWSRRSAEPILVLAAVRVPVTPFSNADLA